MDIRKLQRAIVDGLEDVKGQHIVVFNTEALSPLFERVIIASGTSNRQTKALAASVRDAVKAAGAPPPRTEGEDNGEWIIVDCGAAVAHIMQPAIRDYYRLEEIWGVKPVTLKRSGHPAAKAAKAASGDGKAAPAKAHAPAARSTAAKPASAKSAARKTPAAKAPAKKSSPTGARAKAGAGKAAPKRPAPARSAATRATPPRKTAAGKTATRKAPAARKAARS